MLSDEQKPGITAVRRGGAIVPEYEQGKRRSL
jgi:hypothetical protein